MKTAFQGSSLLRCLIEAAAKSFRASSVSQLSILQRRVPLTKEWSSHGNRK